MIYFDNAATSEVSKAALDKYLEVTSSSFGNSSSAHAFGYRSKRVLEESRSSILACLNLSSTHDLVFTSGSTESNNLALKGVAFQYAKRGKRIITSDVEHPSVLRPLEELRDRFGYDLVILHVSSDGRISPEELDKAMDSSTILVSVMATNNEIGSINDIALLSAVVRKYPKCFFHVDATQALGKADLPFGKADLISFSGHKIGALKGSGALIYRHNVILAPQNEGGEQEDGIRGGTVNVAGAACLAEALQEDVRNMKANASHVKEIRDELLSYFLSKSEILVNSPVDGSPYILNFSLKKKKASVVVEALSNKGVYVSSTSACSSKSAPYSYVVYATTLDKERATESIRLSFSARNTLSEAKEFESIFDGILQEVRDK